MWCIRLLGPLRVEYNGDEVPVGTPQARAVLAILALHANEVVSVGRISEELWGEFPPASAKVQIQGIVSRLRRLLGRHRIATAGAGYVFAATKDELEISRVRDDVADARRMIAMGEVEQGVARLRAVLGCWRGTALADLRSVAHKAEELAEFRMTVLEERVEADLLLGVTGGLIGDLTTMVAEHPFRERCRAQLMTALARSGRIPEALETYAEFRRELVRNWASNRRPSCVGCTPAFCAASPMCGRPFPWRQR